MKTKQSNNTIQAPQHLSPWLDTKAASEYLSTPVGTLKRWRHEGSGPIFSTINRKFIRYHINDLDAFLNTGKNRL